MYGQYLRTREIPGDIILISEESMPCRIFQDDMIFTRAWAKNKYYVPGTFKLSL